MEGEERSSMVVGTSLETGPPQPASRSEDIAIPPHRGLVDWSHYREPFATHTLEMILKSMVLNLTPLARAQV